MKKAITAFMCTVIIASLFCSCMNKTVEDSYDEGPRVYITPKGHKFHFSTTCAGKRAKQVPYNKIKYYYEPCKKCTRD